MATITIRPAVLADAVAIASAQIRCWHWAYRGILRDDFLDGLELAEKSAHWQTLIAENEVAIWVGEVDGRIEGMIVAAPAHWPNMPVSGMVKTFYIAPEAARMGLGSRLWTAAAVYLREQGHNGMYVMVMEANRIGRGFYEKISGTRHPGDFMIAIDGIPQPDCCYYWHF